jgi:hypothetical protein
MTNEFNYLSVLLSVIVGLAMTQILKGYRSILLSNASVRMYWPTMLWSIVLLVMNVQSWWAMFGLRDIRNWNFAVFSIVLLQPIVQYMLAAIIFPDFFGPERVDLREHYWRHVRSFFGLSILVLVVSLAKDVAISGHLKDSLDMSFHLLWIALAVMALLIRREWYHKTAIVLVMLLVCTYIVVLFAHLPHEDATRGPPISGEQQ